MEGEDKNYISSSLCHCASVVNLDPLSSPYNSFPVFEAASCVPPLYSPSPCS